MQKLLIAFFVIFGTSAYSQAGITEALGGNTRECVNEIGEGEASVSLIFFEHVIADKITTRFLKSVSIETEGVTVYAKSYFRPRFVGAQGKNLNEDISVTIGSGWATVKNGDILHELTCTVVE